MSWITWITVFGLTLGVFLLVIGSLFQLVSGFMNTAKYYGPFGFNFTVVHYWVAWITMGALALHIGAKIALARVGWSTPLDDAP